MFRNIKDKRFGRLIIDNFKTWLFFCKSEKDYPIEIENLDKETLMMIKPLRVYTEFYERYETSQKNFLTNQ